MHGENSHFVYYNSAKKVASTSYFKLCVLVLPISDKIIYGKEGANLST